MNFNFNVCRMIFLGLFFRDLSNNDLGSVFLLEDLFSLKYL